MQLTSDVWQEGGPVPAKYTCDGTDINPPLRITDVPEEAKSLVLIMEDPDVPRSARADGVWDHWVVFNISLDTAAIAEGIEPAGVHGKGTSGNLEYHGPCPPDREHRYFFGLYALDTTLDLAEGVSKAEVKAAMNDHVVAEAQLMGLYEREK